MSEVPMTHCKHFGHWLKREIENRVMTQVQFAEHACISRTALFGWLRDPCPKLRGITVARLARALELPREEVERRLDEARVTAGAAEPAAA